MLQSTAVALLVSFWAALYIVDSFLKRNHLLSAHYLDVTSRFGLSVHVAQLRWYTACLNRAFVRVGSLSPMVLKTWFTAGVLFGVVAMILSVLLLSVIIINTLRSESVEQQVLMPVMPGVNLPTNQLGYYLLTLFVCGLFHEFGHAVAAVREHVRVNGFGVFIFALYPGAYVDLSTSDLQISTPLRQLRIYCAGVWHNFIIVIVAIAALVSMPTLLSPCYRTGGAVVITDVVPDSAVSGRRGLVSGDQLTYVDTCHVKSVEEWTACIRDSVMQRDGGFCVPLDTLDQQDLSTSVFTTLAGNVECCSNISETHLCFQYHLRSSAEPDYACLPARSTSDGQPCRVTSDCYNLGLPMTCAKPSLDNSTRLLRVVHNGKPPLLFLGHPHDLYYSVVVSNYVPISSVVPLNLPYVLETFCKYLISLSGALAILNVVPCYALDGQWILLALIELLLQRALPRAEARARVYAFILLCGTVLLGTNIVIALWALFAR